MAKVEPTTGIDQTTATTLPEERDLNSGGAFADYWNETSPAGQISNATTFDFDAVTAHEKDLVSAAQERAAQNPDFSDPSKSTKEIMDQSAAGHTESAVMTPEGSTTAYTSSNVEDTMVAFEESEGTDEGSEKYYYGETDEVETEETSGSSSSDKNKA